MNALSEHIAAPLLTFIEPQVEQLKIATTALPCGVFGSISSEAGTGYLWAASLGDDCLVSVHHLVLEKETVLEEFPAEYSCICSASQATVESSRELRVPHPMRSENLSAFSSDGGAVACLLKAHVPYDSVSVSYTPAFFDKLRRRCPGRFDDIENRLNDIAPDLLPTSLRQTMRSFDPRKALLQGSQRYYRGRAIEAVSLIASAGQSAMKLRLDAPGAVSAEVGSYVSANLSRHITLDDIARHLFMSRSKLCARFQDETGMGVATYLRKQRIDQAKKLLADTDLSISEIGVLTGYPRASSFTETFLRETSRTPSEWRASVR